MTYLVIEDFNEVINLVTDEGGQPKIFKNIEDAEKELSNCQGGYIVPRGDIISALKGASEDICMLKFELLDDEGEKEWGTDNEDAVGKLLIGEE